MILCQDRDTIKNSNYESLVADKKLLSAHIPNKIIVAFSGGKDSLAALLMLLEMGIDRERIEIWHHLIDEPGKPNRFDWPCTESYVCEIAKALGVSLRFSWKEGGFEKELFRNNDLTSGVFYQDGGGNIKYLPPAKPARYCNECRMIFTSVEKMCRNCGKIRDGYGTRLKYPMKTADLSKRWCSAYLKIMVCKRILGNDPRFSSGYYWLISGERRQESAARSKYKEVENHKSNNKNRKTHQWRSVIDWQEQDVWDIIQRWGMYAHPCYYIGFSRCSCMCCIFSNKDQWASIKDIAPEQFDWHSNNERRFGLTISQGESIDQQASCGTSFVKDAPKEIVDLAMSTSYPSNRVFLPRGQKWILPRGAFKRQGGPS